MAYLFTHNAPHDLCGQEVNMEKKDITHLVEAVVSMRKNEYVSDRKWTGLNANIGHECNRCKKDAGNRPLRVTLSTKNTQSWRDVYLCSQCANTPAHLGENHDTILHRQRP